MVIDIRWAGPEKFDGFRLFLQALQNAFPDLPAPPSPLPVFSLADPLVFKKEMVSAGFKDVEVEFVPRELVFESLHELRNLFTVGAPPVKVLLDQVGVDGVNNKKYIHFEFLSTLSSVSLKTDLYNHFLLVRFKKTSLDRW